MRPDPSETVFPCEEHYFFGEGLCQLNPEGEPSNSRLHSEQKFDGAIPNSTEFVSGYGREF